MKNRSPDGRTLRELLESALEGQAGVEATDEGESPGTVVGEVLDTHHPHLPGRVFVRWMNSAREKVEKWVQAERHLSLRKGDRVLLTLPLGWKQWVVTGALGREGCAPVPDDDNISLLTLQPGESLLIRSHEGNPIITIRQGVEGPEIELGNGHVELKAARTLRLKADTIEIESSSGGVDIRSSGDAVVRARTIRLN
jgi:hypothetical protein